MAGKPDASNHPRRSPQTYAPIPYYRRVSDRVIFLNTAPGRQMPISPRRLYPEERKNAIELSQQSLNDIHTLPQHSQHCQPHLFIPYRNLRYNASECRRRHLSFRHPPALPNHNKSTTLRHAAHLAVWEICGADMGGIWIGNEIGGWGEVQAAVLLLDDVFQFQNRAGPSFVPCLFI